MTDYEKLKQCFNEIGIKYRDEEKEKYIQIESHMDDSIIQFIFYESGKYAEMQ